MLGPNTDVYPASDHRERDHRDTVQGSNKENGRTSCEEIALAIIGGFRVHAIPNHFCPDSSQKPVHQGQSEPSFCNYDVNLAAGDGLFIYR